MYVHLTNPVQICFLKGTANIQNFGWSPSVYKDVKNVWKEDLDSKCTVLKLQPNSGSNPLMNKILKSSEWTVKGDLDTPRRTDYGDSQ